MKRKILVSPGYGAGLSSWNRGEVAKYMLTYQPIIDYLESGGKFTYVQCGGFLYEKETHPLLLQLQKECLEKFGVNYVCVLGARDLVVHEVNGLVRIEDYDGDESVEEQGEYQGWMQMKIVAISDLHGHLPSVPECDLLLLAGDLCPATDHRCSFQQHWLDTYFRWWMKDQPAKQIIGIAGNHDFVFQDKPDWVPKSLPWVYLEDSGTEYEGLKVWGSPWQPIFFDWAFNLKEEELEKKWAKIPEGTDIVVLHGPPRGYGDGAPRMIKDKNEEEWPTLEHVGSPSMLERLKIVKPKLTVFGHIHGGYGRWEVNGMILANVSFVDERYNPVHDIQVFHI